MKAPVPNKAHRQLLGTSYTAINYNQYVLSSPQLALRISDLAFAFIEHSPLQGLTFAAQLASRPASTNLMALASAYEATELHGPITSLRDWVRLYDVKRGR